MRSDQNLTNLSRSNAIRCDHLQASSYIRHTTFGTSRKIELKIKCWLTLCGAVHFKSNKIYNDLADTFTGKIQLWHGFGNHISCTFNKTAFSCLKFTVFLFYLINGKLTWISSFRITKHTVLHSAYTLFTCQPMSHCLLYSLTTTILTTTTTKLSEKVHQQNK